jgi:hypothetical protein
MGDAHDGPVRKCSIPYADLKPCLMNVSLTFDRVVIAYQTIMNLVYIYSLPLCNICVTNDHGYVPLVVNTSRSFPRS